MQTIKELINKIKWDKKEKPEDYTLFYYDRILDRLVELKYNKILKLEGNFMIIDNEEESNIPLHRVKKVMKHGKVVWERR